MAAVGFWLLFTGTFFVLGVLHWRQQRDTLPELANTFHIAAVSGVRLGGVEFVDGVNEFVRRLNRQMARSDRITTVGYWGASATAALSALLSYPS